MSSQDPYRAGDLLGRESAEGRNRGCLLPGPAIIAIVVGALSFVVGLYMLSVSKIVAPSEGIGEIDPQAEPFANEDAPPNGAPNPGPAGPAIIRAGDTDAVYLRLKGGNSRVELANTVGLLDPRRDFTVEMWARVNNPDCTQRFFGDRVGRYYGAAKPAVYGGWECGPQFSDQLGGSGRLWAEIAGTDRDVGGAAGGPFNVTPVWHHVAYVNSAGKRWAIFIDGREGLGNEIFWAPGPAPSPINFSIGASPEGLDHGIFDAGVRAFRATSKVRYTQRFVPPRKFEKDPGTVILLDFPGAGSRLKDLAGNHDGKIVNADWIVGAPPDPEQMPDKLTTPGLRLTENSFVEIANTVGLLDGMEFCVEAWIKTPAFTGEHSRTGEHLHLFGDNSWHLHAKPGDKKWDMMISVGGQSWYENYALEPLTIYHIALVRGENSIQLSVNGEGPGGSLQTSMFPGTDNFCIGHKPLAADPALPGAEIYAFRASSRARYRGGFIPQVQFTRDADTLILLEFSGKGTTLKDLAGNHDGRIINATWVPGTR
jgi:hypothetical protein